MFLICIILLGSDFIYGKEIDIQTLGKHFLKLSDSQSVKLEFFDEVEYVSHREWEIRLILSADSKALKPIDTKYPIHDKEPYTADMFYFVPIKDGKYLLDLDMDGSKEFAVVYDHGGNAPATSVTVFSVKNDRLTVYKKAWYAMEGGNSVIWDEKKAPKKCFYTSEGVCEFL
jgi:hypothetical protein